MKEITFNGWNAVELSNEHLQLIVTKSVGPRLISLKGKEGREFMFHHPDQKGVKGGEKWNIFGGHRLWHSPEVEPRTYAPDNDPVEIIPLNGGIVARQTELEGAGGLLEKVRVDVFQVQLSVVAERTIRTARNAELELVDAGILIREIDRAVLGVAVSDRLLGKRDLRDPGGNGGELTSFDINAAGEEQGQQERCHAKKSIESHRCLEGRREMGREGRQTTS